METGARARGLAGWARGRALGDGVSGRWVAAAKVPSIHTRMTTHSGRVPQRRDPALRMPAKTMRCGARCAILIGSTAIRNLRIPLKPHDMFFSNRSKRACLRSRLAQVSHTMNRQSHHTTRAFLIATQLLEIELTSSQQTRKLFLIASFCVHFANATGLATGHSSLITAHSTHHLHLRRRTILQAVQHQLHTRRNAKLVENPEQIIAYDYLLAGGWTARRVAIGCYFFPAFLGLLGWFAVDGGIKRTVILGVGVFAVFILSALWLGARRGAMQQAR